MVRQVIEGIAQPDVAKFIRDGALFRRNPETIYTRLARRRANMPSAPVPKSTRVAGSGTAATPTVSSSRLTLSRPSTRCFKPPSNKNAVSAEMCKVRSASGRLHQLSGSPVNLRPVLSCVVGRRPRARRHPGQRAGSWLTSACSRRRLASKSDGAPRLKPGVRPLNNIEEMSE